MTILSRLRFFVAALFAMLAAIAAYSAHLHWAAHYYEGFHETVCAASLVSAYLLRGKPLALATCIAVAVIFNPLAPFRMPEFQWQRYDIGCGIAMGAVAVYSWFLQFGRSRRKGLLG